MSFPRVVVTGTLGFDYIMNLSERFADRIMPEKIHQISLSFLVNNLKKQFGGTAGNIAYTLKLLGIDPLIVAPAGKDFAPYKKFLKKHNVSTLGIREYAKEMMGSYFVITDIDDNQIGSFYGGATKYADKLSVTDVSEKSSVFVVLAPTDPTAMKKYVDECQKLRLPYLYDPAFQIGSFSADELRNGISGAQILIGNDYEISLMAKKLSISENKLLLSVPVAIVTLGAKGSTIYSKGHQYDIPTAKPKAIVDPTGAGDAYRGGFLAGYLRGVDLQACGQMGAVAAAYTVELYGTVTHKFTPSQFCRRYQRNFGQKLLLTNETSDEKNGK